MNYIAVTEHPNAGSKQVLIESGNVVQVYESDMGNAVIKFGNKETAQVTELISTAHTFYEVARAIANGTGTTWCTTDITTPETPAV